MPGQRLDDALLGQIPDQRDVVFAGAEDLFAIARKHRVAHLAAVAVAESRGGIAALAAAARRAKGKLQGTAGRVKDADVLVATGG